MVAYGNQVTKFGISVQNDDEIGELGDWFMNINYRWHIFTAVVGFSPLLVVTMLRCVISPRFFKIKINESTLTWNEVVSIIFAS